MTATAVVLAAKGGMSGIYNVALMGMSKQKYVENSAEDFTIAS